MKKEREIKKDDRPSPALHVTRYTLHDARGQAMLIATVFLLAVAISIMLGVATPTLRQTRIAENFVASRQSYAASESGVEDALYRLKKGKQVSATETLTVGSTTATTTVADVGSNEKEVAAEGAADNRIRKTTALVTVSSGTAFNYGVQVGNGGFLIQNTASVLGNIYSNGPVRGENKNVVYGDAVSAGSSGILDNIRATSSAYAHTITDSTIDKDAYYQSISNTTVGGTSHPGSADQPAAALPISDGTVAQWETDAQSGGVVNSPCPYKIKEDITIGPVKINCDLEISNDPTITLNGAVWVNGSITIKNSPVIKVAPSLGNKSVAIIADNPSDQFGSSQVNLENSAGFQGSGSAGSYVVLLSQNKSAETGGDEVAIDLQNGAQGDLLLYAGHGEVLIRNSSSLKEVTAYKVHLKNSAQVKYKSGMPNLLFTGGPAGAWSVKSWKETE